MQFATWLFLVAFAYGIGIFWIRSAARTTTAHDLACSGLSVRADGTMIHNPRCYRRAERRLKTAQRKVLRRKKGSNRRRKAVKLLARAHQQVKRQRADFHHKARSPWYANTIRSLMRSCRLPTW